MTLLATVMIGGIFSLWGAVVAGVFFQLVPFIFQAQWGINPNFLLIIFGVGLLQVLLTAPGGIVQQMPKDIANLARLVAGAFRKAAAEQADMIEVEGLTVRFAGVTPIDDMSVVFPGGTCGLIGPNGAGKTTFFNVLSGFVRPATGSIAAFGEDLLRMADYQRARWGLRRTFQTEQAIEKLSVFDNVAMIHEHSGAKRASRRADVLGAIDFVGLETPPKSKVGEARSPRTTARRDRPCRRRQARGWCCSTSPPRDSPTRRRALGEVIQGSPSGSARWSSSSTTT